MKKQGYGLIIYGNLGNFMFKDKNGALFKKLRFFIKVIY